MISAGHIEYRPTWPRRLGTAWSQGRDDLTCPPWIICPGNEYESSGRVLEPVPATSVEVCRVVCSTCVEGIGKAILSGEPLRALPCPIGVLYEAGDDRLSSTGCTVLPPKEIYNYILKNLKKK